MLIDNKKTAKIGDTLKDVLKNESRLSIVSGLFSIYAFDALKKELTKSKDTNLLLTQLDWNNESTNFPALTGDKFEIRLRNQLNQAAIASECAKWLKNKTQVKATNLAGVVPY